MSESRPFVVLGVCGGIAAYKAIELCRQLVDAGCHVAPILTKEATHFVTPLTFSALASEPAQIELFDPSQRIPHTRLGQEADVIVVAPATANLIGRYANGLADDLLTNTLIASRAPVVLAPAMHTEMWEHDSVARNVQRLAERGVRIVGPASGHLAGGDEGPGRLEDPSTIARAVLDELARNANRDLAGTRVVISAGGTREAIDPVRVLTNRSSGKQGYAIAEAALARGAAVTLVSTANLPDPAVRNGSLSVVRVETAAEMLDAMRNEAKEADIVVMAAAVADFRPTDPLDAKFKKEDGALSISLEPTEDILATLCAERSGDQVIVGFAAETNDVLDNARKKLAKKGCDLLVVNDVSAERVGFDHETNEVTILSADGHDVEVALTSKRAVGDAILDKVVSLAAKS
jgi:phosphopantothenoylcysteine decarboxylase / phosphopantothenate---cysteine ligase